MRQIVVTTILFGTLLWGATSKVDEKSGLVWQDDGAVAIESKSYAEAKAYCAALEVDGFGDWRLPTLRELYTIVDLARDRPALKAGFAVRSDAWFWSATPYAGDPKREAWQLSFAYGEAEPVRMDRALHVRCVRSR